MEMLHFAGDFTGYNGTEEDFAYKLSARYGNITYEEAKNVYDSIMYIRFSDTDKGRSYYKKNVLVLYRKAAEEIYKELKEEKKNSIQIYTLLYLTLILTNNFFRIIICYI